MRIIAGLYKGRHLKSTPSLEVRPTSDRLRETLFNILAPRIANARFLDLCAGTGAVGIEALSRGARHATFLDRSRKMCGLVESNLDLCRIPEDQTEVVNDEASDYLRRVIVQSKPAAWEIVYFDPPYKQDYLSVMELLGEHPEAFLDKNGIVIVEHYHKTALPEVVGRIELYRTLKQGDAVLSFYRLRETATPKHTIGETA